MAVGATQTGTDPETGPAYLHVYQPMTAGHKAGVMAALPSPAPPRHAFAAAGLSPGGTGPITPSKSTAGSHTLNRSSVQPARPCQEAPQGIPFTPARRAACCPQSAAHPRHGHNPDCCSAPPHKPRLLRPCSWAASQIHPSAAQPLQRHWGPPYPPQSLREAAGLPPPARRGPAKAPGRKVRAQGRQLYRPPAERGGVHAAPQPARQPAGPVDLTSPPARQAQGCGCS